MKTNRTQRVCIVILLLMFVNGLLYSRAEAQKKGKKTSRREPSAKITATPIPTPAPSLFETRAILFSPDEIKFEMDYWSVIQEVCEKIKLNKDICIRIEGYSGISTNQQSSKQIASDRAAWVKKCMLAESVDEAQIIDTKGYDALESSHSYSSGKTNNDRVDIVISKCVNFPPAPTQKFEADPQDPFRYIIK